MKKKTEERQEVEYKELIKEESNLFDLCILKICQIFTR